MRTILPRPVEPLPRDSVMQPRQRIPQRAIGQPRRWSAGLVSWSNRPGCCVDDHVGEAQPLDRRAAEGKIDLPDQDRGEMLKRQRVRPSAANCQRSCCESDGLAARGNVRSGNISPVGNQRAEHGATPPQCRSKHGSQQSRDSARRVVPRRLRERSHRRFS